MTLTKFLKINLASVCASNPDSENLPMSLRSSILSRSISFKYDWIWSFDLSIALRWACLSDLSKLLTLSSRVTLGWEIFLELSVVLRMRRRQPLISPDYSCKSLNCQFSIIFRILELSSRTAFVISTSSFGAKTISSFNFSIELEFWSLEALPYKIWLVKNWSTILTLLSSSFLIHYDLRLAISYAYL